jgi:hypothetical protein
MPKFRVRCLDCGFVGDEDDFDRSQTLTDAGLRCPRCYSLHTEGPWYPQETGE